MRLLCAAPFFFPTGNRRGAGGQEYDTPSGTPNIGNNPLTGGTPQGSKVDELPRSPRTVKREPISKSASAHAISSSNLAAGNATSAGTSTSASASSSASSAAASSAKSKQKKKQRKIKSEPGTSSVHGTGSGSFGTNSRGTGTQSANGVTTSTTAMGGVQASPLLSETSSDSFKLPDPSAMDEESSLLAAGTSSSSASSTATASTVAAATESAYPDDDLMMAVSMENWVSFYEKVWRCSLTHSFIHSFMH